MNDIAIRISGFATDKHARAFAKWLEEEGMAASSGYMGNCKLKHQLVDCGETYPLNYDLDGNIAIVLGPEVQNAPPASAAQPKPGQLAPAQPSKKYVPPPVGGG